LKIFLCNANLRFMNYAVGGGVLRRIFCDATSQEWWYFHSRNKRFVLCY